MIKYSGMAIETSNRAGSATNPTWQGSFEIEVDPSVDFVQIELRDEASSKMIGRKSFKLFQICKTAYDFFDLEKDNKKTAMVYLNTTWEPAS